MTARASTYREFADRVLAAADIAEVVGQYVELRRAGANLKGLCPFHQEKTPSFNVHPGKQIFKCFGCGKGGDALTFVREIERVDFRQALEILAGKYGLETPQFEAKGPDEEQVRWRQTLHEVLEHATRYYQERLAHPDHGAQGRRYLEARQVRPETAERFRLGLAGEDWEGLTTHLKGKGYSEKTLLEAGLAREKKRGEGVYDYLRGRLVFPIANSRGEIIGFGGRALGEETPKYLNTPESELFQKGRELYGLVQAREALTREGRPAVLAEGYMDVVACHQAGVAAAVASMGTALTPDQARLIRRYAQEAVFFYDADEAGVKAILRGIEILIAAGLTVRVGRLPLGEDPDSFAREKGAEALRGAVDGALGFFDFLLDQARARYDLASPEGRVHALDLLAPALAAIAEPLVYDGYVTRLAAELAHDEQSLREYLRNQIRRKGRGQDSAAGPVETAATAGGVLPPRTAGRKGAATDGFRPDEEAVAQAALLGAGPPSRREMGLLHILLEHSDARLLLRDRLNPEWIAHPLVRYWAASILNLTDGVIDVWSALTAVCPSEEHEAFLQSALFSADEPHEEDYVAIAEHLCGVIEADHLRSQNRRINLLIEEIARGTRSGDISQQAAAQLRNSKRIEEIERSAKESAALQVKYP
ncbi:MAG TPA: DNA primase [Sumerlaeia bacterium]|nr:DNA primase [Sumerlaeia bacterium]